MYIYILYISVRENLHVVNQPFVVLERWWTL